MYYGSGGQTKLKDDLRLLVAQKLRVLAVYPTNITSSLKNRIQDLQDEFLELRQSKKFTKEKGVEMLDEIDSINDEMKKLPKSETSPIDEELMMLMESRKKRTIKSKSKRKIVKHKISKKKK